MVLNERLKPKENKKSEMKNEVKQLTRHAWDKRSCSTVSMSDRKNYYLNNLTSANLYVGNFVSSYHDSLFDIDSAQSMNMT